MFLRNIWTVVLLAGLPGCALPGANYTVDCLEQNHNDPGCCPDGSRISNGTCCSPGSHGATDVEHPEWVVCVADKDAGIDAEANAGTDAATDAGADAP